MASEFIEVISPQAKQQIADIMVQVDLLASKIKSIPNFQLANTPSGADNNIKQLTTDLNQQAKSLDTVATNLGKVNQERQKSATLTTQQKVDNAILLKDEKLKAVLTSKVADAYQKLNAERELAKIKLQKLIATEKESNAEIRKAQKEFDVLNKKVAAADKAVGRFSEANRSINGLSRSVGNLMTAFGVGTGLYLAVDIAKNIYNTTKELQSLDLALKMVSGTTKEFAENQAFIRGTAEKWGIEIKGLTQQYTQFYTAAKGILSDASIKQVFESISKSGALMGLSVEKQNATFYAFEQMMSKGIVTAEELRKQLGNAMPGALRAAGMAYMDLHPQITSIQIAERELMKEMKRGAIDSATYVPLIVKNFEKLYGIEQVNKVDTLRSAQERLANSWTDMVRTMNEGETGGLQSFFKGAISLAQAFLDELNGIISSWDMLQKKANVGGVEKGKKQFEKGILSAKTKEEADIYMAFEEKVARENIIRQQTEIEIKNKRIADLKKVTLKNVLGAFVGYGATEIKAAEQAIQRALESRGISEGMMQAIDEQRSKSKSKIIPKAVADGKPETESQRKKREADELRALKESMKVESVGNLTLSKEQDTALEKLKMLREALEKTRDETAKNAVEFAQFEKSIKGVNDAIDVITKPLTTDITAELEAKVKPYNDAKKSKLEQDREDLEAIRRTFNEFAGGFSEKLGFGETFDFFGQQDENGKTYFGKLLEAEDKTKAYFLAISTAAQDAFNIMSEASQRNFEQEYERLEKQKETALKFAGESDAAKQKIEEDYAKRRRIIEKREFKAKQQQAIVNIAIDTAQAVMAVNAKAQWWMTPVMIALGIAQTAMVASQKYKEYWKGTDNAEAGLAWTQEKGAEIILDKHNRVKSFGSDGGAELTMMESGDKVIDANKTKKLMFDNGLNSILSDNGIKQAKIEIVSKGLTVDEMRGVMLETLGEQTHYHTNISNGEITNMMIKNGNKTIRNSNRASGIGIRV